MLYAIKVEVADPPATSFEFVAQKTMYGGKRIAEGDTLFIFASENEGGAGLIARGTFTSAQVIPLKPGLARQIPRVGITVQRITLAKQRLVLLSRFTGHLSSRRCASLLLISDEPQHNIPSVRAELVEALPEPVEDSL